MPYEQLKLENQVCFRLYTVARLMTQAYQPWLSQLGITYTQYIVLMVLWEQDHQPVNDIAKRLYLETNTVTPLIKRMETLKIVTRRKDKEDARKTIVSLTERGKAMEQEASKIPACLTGILCEKGLNVDDFVQMVTTLDRMIAQMAK